jgi:UDPglucose 6-dehydrogenase
MPKAKELLKGVVFARDPYDAARGADAVALVTEWKEYKDLDMKKVRALVRTPVFLDGRNLYDPASLTAEGFQVHAVGRTPLK